MGIACIGWGSLIWDPGKLPIDGKWRPNGPELQLEFVRHSGGDRLTLVLDAQADAVPTLWTSMLLDDLDAAKEALRSRERTSIDKIGSYTRDDAPPVDTLREPIHTWFMQTQYDAVIWTDLPPR